MLENGVIYKIDINSLNNRHLMSAVYDNLSNEYYWSDEYDSELYISLAKAGFISVGHILDDTPILLAQIQSTYAVLDFENLHISKKVQKLINQNSFELKINSDIKNVITAIQQCHIDSWLNEQYKSLLVEMSSNNQNNQKIYDFQIVSVGLYDTTNQTLVAGEIGYVTNNIYTSLSGFSLKEKRYNNCGKLQLILLSKYLQNNGFSFWNLGQSQMQYKIDIGAVVYSRDEFLRRWLA